MHNQSLMKKPPSQREGVGGGLRDAPIMGTAAVGVAQKEDDEQGIDEQDIFDRVILFLPAITVRLFNRVLGADDAPLGPVMGKKGGLWRGCRDGGHGCGLLRQGRNHGGRVGLRHAEPLRQGRQGAGRGIAEGAQCREQRRQEDVDPLVGFALDHAE